MWIYNLQSKKQIIFRLIIHVACIQTFLSLTLNSLQIILQNKFVSCKTFWKTSVRKAVTNTSLYLGNSITKVEELHLKLESFHSYYESNYVYFFSIDCIDIYHTSEKSKLITGFSVWKLKIQIILNTDVKVLFIKRLG